MDKKLILDLISKGEDDKVEFKLHMPNERIIAIVLTSFANTSGGYLFFGINDEGIIIGLNEQECKSMFKRLSSICQSLFSFHYQIEQIELKGKSVVYVYVSEAPKYLKPISTSDGKIFKRVADKSIELRKHRKKFTAKLKTNLPNDEIKGFVAMSFRDEEEPALIDYYRAMERAVERSQLPIRLMKMNLQEGDYEISQQIMTEISETDFVIGDFSFNSYNVYFEIGYARGKGKYIIQTALKDTELQFDVQNWKTKFYRNATELEEKLIPALKTMFEELNT